VELTDEHIVPLALNGQHIIRKASCLVCADITKKFEQDVARGLWGDARTSYDAPSRRKRARKTHITLTDPDNPARRIKVPYSEYPAPMAVYKMGRAGLLEGLPETVDISGMWKIEAISDGEKNKAFEQKYGMKLTARFRHVPASYARLIAKIGYGQILCSLDPGDFTPICIPYMLGHKSNVSFVVCGSPDYAAPDSGKGYGLRTAGFGTPERLMLMAEVRLLANNQSPTHHVVVGEVVGRERVAAVGAKLGDVQIEMLPSALPRAAPATHWMPGCWPLPFWAPVAG